MYVHIYMYAPIRTYLWILYYMNVACIDVCHDTYPDGRGCLTAILMPPSPFFTPIV